jgi:hypothetical protein
MGKDEETEELIRFSLRVSKLLKRNGNSKTNEIKLRSEATSLFDLPAMP